MNPNEGDGCITFLIVLLIMCLFGLVGQSLSKNNLKQQAIDHGFAEYSSTTGEWQWKEEK